MIPLPGPMVKRMVALVMLMVRDVQVIGNGHNNWLDYYCNLFHVDSWDYYDVDGSLEKKNEGNCYCCSKEYQDVTAVEVVAIVGGDDLTSVNLLKWQEVAKKDLPTIEKDLY